VDISEGSPIYFKAVEPEKVIASLRDEYLKSAEEVIVKLKSYQRERKEEWSPIWYLQGEWSIKSKVEGLAERSEREFIAAFVDGILALRFKKAFKIAKRKRLDIKIILLERNKRCLNALRRFGEVFSISLKRILNEEQEDFREVLTKALFASEVPYRVKGIFVRDGRESILVYEEKEVLRGLIVRLPFIPLFQRMMILYLIESIEILKSWDSFVDSAFPEINICTFIDVLNKPKIAKLMESSSSTKLEIWIKNVGTIDMEIEKIIRRHI